MIGGTRTMAFEHWGETLESLKYYTRGGNRGDVWVLSNNVYGIYPSISALSLHTKFLLTKKYVGFLENDDCCSGFLYVSEFLKDDWILGVMSKDKGKFWTVPRGQGRKNKTSQFVNIVIILQFRSARTIGEQAVLPVNRQGCGHRKIDGQGRKIWSWSSHQHHPGYSPRSHRRETNRPHSPTPMTVNFETNELSSRIELPHNKEDVFLLPDSSWNYRSQRLTHCPSPSSWLLQMVESHTIVAW